MRKVFDSYQDNDYYITVASYLNNNRLYLGIEDKLENIITDISINLPELELNNNQIFLNADLDEEIKDKLIKNGIITNLNGYKDYNMESYMKVDINIEKLKEYDELGIEEHLNKINEMER